MGKIDYEARAKGGLQEGDDGASMALGRYVLRYIFVQGYNIVGLRTSISHIATTRAPFLFVPIYKIICV